MGPLFQMIGYMPWGQRSTEDCMVGLRNCVFAQLLRKMLFSEVIQSYCLTLLIMNLI